MKDIRKELQLSPDQSLELLKELHILTREGSLNQDSRRKLKQVMHLLNFLKPYIHQAIESSQHLKIVDHGAGKSYLGFLIYDLYLKNQLGTLWSVERREDLCLKGEALAKKLNFTGMKFLSMDGSQALESAQLPENLDLVTALHACDSATDEAIDFALKKKARAIFLVPCCQAEVARHLSQQKNKMMSVAEVELWRHAHHTREFGSHLTNVLRCLRLEAHGYQVTVTELTGLEHSLKNELIFAVDKNLDGKRSLRRLEELINKFSLESLSERFSVDVK